MRFLAVSVALISAVMAPSFVLSFGVSCPFSSIRSRHSTSLVPSYMSNRDSSSTSSSTTRSNSNNNKEAPQAHDGEALQALFSKQCDQDGLMTKDMLKSIPVIAELLVRHVYPILPNCFCVTWDYKFALELLRRNLLDKTHDKNEVNKGTLGTILDLHVLIFILKSSFFVCVCRRMGTCSCRN